MFSLVDILGAPFEHLLDELQLQRENTQKYPGITINRKLSMHIRTKWGARADMLIAHCLGLYDRPSNIDFVQEQAFWFILRQLNDSNFRCRFHVEWGSS